MSNLLFIHTYFRKILTRMSIMGASIFILGLTLNTLFQAPVTFAAVRVAARSASGGGAIIYVHKATTANSTQNWTDLDNNVTNNNPQAIIFVTPNWNPTGSLGVFNKHPIGVWYHNGRWAIFNQDYASIPVGASFNVYALPAADGSDTLVQTATASNTNGYDTTIDNPYSNGQKDMILLVTPNWNPTGSIGIFDNHPIGVWYHNGKWNIFNQDHVAIPVGTSFNVVVLQNIVEGASIHTTTTNNIQKNWTNLNTSTTNNNPNAIVFITPKRTTQNVFVNHNLGIWYTFNHRWAIFNQDFSSMPVSASFDIVTFAGPIIP